MHAATESVDPGFRLISVEIKDLTYDLAAGHASMEASPTERDKSDSRVDFLQTKMLNGLFLTPSWVIARRKYDGGKLVRINGQHTSNGIVGLGEQWDPAGHKVMVEIYEVDSPEAEALVFRQIDARQSGRTPLDVCGAYIGLHADLKALDDKKLIKKAIEAMVWQEKTVEEIKGLKQSDSRYETVEDPNVRAFCVWLHGFLAMKPKEMMGLTILGAIYSTWKKNPDDAAEFWRLVPTAANDGETQEPALVLGGWLSDEYNEPSDDVGKNNLYQGSIFAWNQHRAKKQITAVKYAIRNGRFLETAD